jgi:hypothetical protein
MHVLDYTASLAAQENTMAKEHDGQNRLCGDGQGNPFGCLLGQ